MNTMIDPLLITTTGRVVPRSALQSAPRSRTNRPVVHPVARQASHGRPARGMSATMRRRCGVAVVALVAFIAVFSMLNSVVSADGADAMHTEVPRTVIAQPGDTIWAIARRVMPHGNINSLVDQLVKLNGATISVGQSIRIP